MSAFRMSKTFTVVIALALTVSACGSSAAQDSVISTAVAQTVQAGQVPTETATALPTITPGSEITITPAITATGPATVAAVAPADPNCAKASLLNENPPDETILTPGQYFWKTWTLQNTGTCTWTTAYALVFWNGNRMGSSLSYALPNDVEPGQSTDISIYLQAPATGGTFTGFWRIKTPWESNFGVGQYDVDISTTIVVSSITPESRKTETVFGITSVTYTIDRTCGAANTFYTITAYISSNGPIKINFMWVQSDGNNDEINQLTFTEASTKAVKREWSQHKESSPNPRWIQVIVTSPTHQEFDQAVLPDFCIFK